MGNLRIPEQLRVFKTLKLSKTITFWPFHFYEIDRNYSRLYFNQLSHQMRKNPNLSEIR